MTCVFALSLMEALKGCVFTEPNKESTGRISAEKQIERNKNKPINMKKILVNTFFIFSSFSIYVTNFSNEKFLSSTQMREVTGWKRCIQKYLLFSLSAFLTPSSVRMMNINKKCAQIHSEISINFSNKV